MKTDNPYKHLHENAFWRSAVAETGVFGYRNLWASKWALPADARFSTFGSCFAQHISRALLARGLNWYEAEPAPGRTPAPLARKYNFGVFSARTGNIYTGAQLLLWTRLATSQALVNDVEIWKDDAGRHHDTLRPNIEPNGFASADEARASLATTARAFFRSFSQADVFVFTLGLTEGWSNIKSAQLYPLCPGTGVGKFDPEIHKFGNGTYPQITEDLKSSFALMKAENPNLKILLTVSPVPLVATASGDHVLVATTYSKSVLRAVAGDLASASAEIDYFPSYEIIASPPTRAAFFQPNMREIAPQGVELVMEHFFAGLDISAQARHNTNSDSIVNISTIQAESDREDLICEELILENFNQA